MTPEELEELIIFWKDARSNHGWEKGMDWFEKVNDTILALEELKERIIIGETKGEK